MRHLTVLFDESCALCRRARAWLEKQQKLSDEEAPVLRFVAAGSEEARRLFPELDVDGTLEELTVVGDGGEVYRGAKAWVVCLWALPEYRSLALDLSSPEMMPLARRAIAAVSKNRYALSRLVG